MRIEATAGIDAEETLGAGTAGFRADGNGVSLAIDDVDLVIDAAFFAGGGTNNPFTNYSAYCVSKILLMKMCELLDDELPDLNAFIVGPGFLPTKIHAPTFANPDAAGENYAKTVDFHSEQARAATCRDIYDCVNWCVAQGRDVVGGRNIAAVHDPWRSDGEWLAAQLRRDGNRFKLRRAGNIGTPAGVTR